MRLIVACYFLLSPLIAGAQSVCASLSVYKKYLSKPDSIYIPAYDTLNPQLCAFPGQEDTVLKTWKKFHQALNLFLKDHNFQWQDIMRCTVFIYCKENSKIDFFFYQFKRLEQEEDFQNWANEFIRNYQVELQSTKKYKLSGCVNYKQLK